MELPVDHLEHAMAPGQMASGIWCNPCSEFAMEVVMGADLGFAIIAPQSGELAGLNYVEFLDQTAARFLLTSGHGSGIFS